MCKDLQDLRAKISRRAHNVLFAESQTSGRDMQEILREVLDKWADQEIHAATVLTRLARCEGAVGESQGLAGESEGVHAPAPHSHRSHA
jgi:hypothetical protein